MARYSAPTVLCVILAAATPVFANDGQIDAVFAVDYDATQREAVLDAGAQLGTARTDDARRELQELDEEIALTAGLLEQYERKLALLRRRRARLLPTEPHRENAAATELPQPPPRRRGPQQPLRGALPLESAFHPRRPAVQLSPAGGPVALFFGQVERTHRSGARQRVLADGVSTSAPARLLFRVAYDGGLSVQTDLAAATVKTASQAAHSVTSSATLCGGAGEEDRQCRATGAAFAAHPAPVLLAGFADGSAVAWDLHVRHDGYSVAGSPVAATSGDRGDGTGAVMGTSVELMRRCSLHVAKDGVVGGSGDDGVSRGDDAEADGDDIEVPLSLAPWPANVRWRAVGQASVHADVALPQWVVGTSRGRVLAVSRNCTVVAALSTSAAPPTAGQAPRAGGGDALWSAPPTGAPVTALGIGSGLIAYPASSSSAALVAPLTGGGGRDDDVVHTEVALIQASLGQLEPYTCPLPAAAAPGSAVTALTFDVLAPSVLWVALSDGSVAGYNVQLPPAGPRSRHGAAPRPRFGVACALLHFVAAPEGAVSSEWEAAEEEDPHASAAHGAAAPLSRPLDVGVASLRGFLVVVERGRRLRVYNTSTVLRGSGGALADAGAAPLLPLVVGAEDLAQEPVLDSDGSGDMPPSTAEAGWSHLPPYQPIRRLATSLDAVLHAFPRAYGQQPPETQWRADAAVALEVPRVRAASPRVAGQSEPQPPSTPAGTSAALLLLLEPALPYHRDAELGGGGTGGGRVDLLGWYRLPVLLLGVVVIVLVHRYNNRPRAGAGGSEGDEGADAAGLWGRGTDGGIGMRAGPSAAADDDGWELARRLLDGVLSVGSRSPVGMAFRAVLRRFWLKPRGGSGGAPSSSRDAAAHYERLVERMLMEADAQRRPVSGRGLGGATGKRQDWRRRGGSRGGGGAPWDAFAAEAAPAVDELPPDASPAELEAMQRMMARMAAAAAAAARAGDGGGGARRRADSDSSGDEEFLEAAGSGGVGASHGGGAQDGTAAYGRGDDSSARDDESQLPPPLSPPSGYDDGGAEASARWARLLAGGRQPPADADLGGDDSASDNSDGIS
jgi:hypothetical protein